MLNNNGRRFSIWKIHDFENALTDDEFKTQYQEYLSGKRELDKFIIRGMVSRDMKIYDSNFIKLCEENGTKFIFSGKKKVIDITNLDISHLTDISDLFCKIEDFNQNISSWDVSKVTDFRGIFESCHDFNQDINSWDVSSAIHMTDFFYNCTSFNQTLDKWDTSNVIDMSYMFSGAKKFNQDINSWDVTKVVDFTDFLAYVNNYTHYLGDWKILTNNESPYINDLEFNEHNDITRYSIDRLVTFIDEYKNSSDNDKEKNKYDLKKFVKQFQEVKPDEFKDIVDNLKNNNMSIEL